LSSAVLVLANMAAYGANPTSAAIALQATVQSTDNLTCAGTASFSNVVFGTPATTTVNCSVTTNDTNGVTMTVYASNTSFMSGTQSGNAIPVSALDVYTSGAATGQANTQTAYTALAGTGWQGASAGNSGLDVATFADSDTAYSPVLNLQLTLPASTKADTYTGTLNVTITPIS
jgi:hypothetical protein